MENTCCVSQSHCCVPTESLHEISRLCPKDHDHLPIQGANTAHSGAYPTAFGTAVVKAFDRSSGRRVAFVTTNLPLVKSSGAPEPIAAGSSGGGPGSALAKVDGEDGEQEPYGAAAISFKGKVNPLVASTLKRVHQNLGHPPNRELIRHLKIGGAPKAVYCKLPSNWSVVLAPDAASHGLTRWLPSSLLWISMRWWRPTSFG